MAFLGRGRRENVTRGASFLMDAAVRTGMRASSASDPNGPFRSRSATIRRPVPGGSAPMASISPAEARSRSMVVPGGAMGRRAGARRRPWGGRARERGARLPATEPGSRAACSAGDPCRNARYARTEAPSSATAAMNMSALRSAGVGIPHTIACGGVVCRGRGSRAGAFVRGYCSVVTSVAATSPTIRSDSGESLSMVSESLWW